MSIAARGQYNFPAKDIASNFPLPVLYVGWDQHMMFCAPFAVLVDPDMKFVDLQQQLLPTLFGEHPDFKRIDWPRVQWFRSDNLFTPDTRASVHDNGFGHKSVLRFRTPGLEGVKGSCG